MVSVRASTLLRRRKTHLLYRDCARLLEPDDRTQRIQQRARRIGVQPRSMSMRPYPVEVGAEPSSRRSYLQQATDCSYWGHTLSEPLLGEIDRQVYDASRGPELRSSLAAIPLRSGFCFWQFQLSRRVFPLKRAPSRYRVRSALRPARRHRQDQAEAGPQSPKIASGIAFRALPSGQPVLNLFRRDQQDRAQLYESTSRENPARMAN